LIINTDTIDKEVTSMIWTKKITLTEENIYKIFSNKLPHWKIQIESFTSGAFIVNLSSIKHDVYIEILKSGLIGVSIIYNKKWEDVLPFGGADIEFNNIPEVIQYIQSKQLE
jgi:hypothetical protein